jgi:KDO2-lipid IV(A) lauroyltransferase
MWGRLRHWLLVRTEAPSVGRALRYMAEYAALRAWCLVIGCFPIETNLATARLLGRLWWLLTKRHRDRAMDNLRRALGNSYDERRLRSIARRSFEHFAQVYLVEMIVTPRIINPWSWARHVRLDDLGPALRELMSARGVIMLTAHFGNYELLGFTLARLGLPLVAVMRPLDNPLLNRYLMAAREAGGLALLYKRGATQTADSILRTGGTLCYIADQDAGRKGLFVQFFGRPASTYKSIGLLAARHEVPVVVGSAIRVGRGLHYRISVQRIIRPEEWRGRDDARTWVTQAFSDALEAAIREAPEQYLWVHRRWKHQPGTARRRREQVGAEGG